MSPVLVTLIYWLFVIWGGVVCVQPSSLALRLSLLLTPQALWLVLVILRARAPGVGKW
ncbi:hypothetical protein [Asaia platycodi]|uniref:hypothetical protein n=1 Tax=Asaia platycodi TaxID=610243 RepID=UPI000AB8E8C7|nr:hypothetical protein [Asaia platycodi]